MLEIVAKDLDTGYTLKASATAGFFYCFNSLTNPINQHSIPGTIERSKYWPKTPQQTVAITAEMTSYPCQKNN